MRWSWLRAAILGLVIGPAPVPVESAEAEPPEPEIPSAKPSGYSVRGLHFHVWSEDLREAEDWASQLLLSSSGDRVEAHRWREFAARSAALPPIPTADLETQLEAWIETSTGDPGSSPLGLVMCLLPSIDRTCLISSWATSRSERVRCALAGALGSPFEAVGVYGAIEHLQHDPSVRVSQLARFAAARRHISHG
jgi:hypothetical protein